MGRSSGREPMVWRCEAGPGSVSHYQSGGAGGDCEGELGEGGSWRVRVRVDGQMDGWMDGCDKTC